MAILKGIISKMNGSAGNLTFKQTGALTHLQRTSAVFMEVGGTGLYDPFQRTVGDAATRGMTSSPWVRRVAVPPIVSEYNKMDTLVNNSKCNKM